MAKKGQLPENWLCGRWTAVSLNLINWLRICSHMEGLHTSCLICLPFGVLEHGWRKFGDPKNSCFYLACGFTAAAAQLLFSNAPAVGASGAIMGLFAAFAYLFPNAQLIMFPIPVPVKAKWAIAIMAAIDLFGGVNPTGSNIAHFAHLGGLIMGFILVIYWNKTNKKTFY